MQIIKVTQGTPEWAAYRANHFNASDAPAMMGCSPHKTRSKLLSELFYSFAPEPDSYTAKIFEEGHKFEGLARAKAEELIGQDLFPVVGIEGKLSASFDGLTIDDSIAWEHKTLNAELKDCMIDNNAANLPLHYRVQIEHQWMVSKCDRILFTASEWTAEGELVDMRHCWYEHDEKLSQDIAAGWQQFSEDLKNYTPPQIQAHEPVGQSPETLPALHIEVTGQVTTSNLATFKETALTAIRRVNKELSTDQDFANAEASVKWCSDVESRLAAAKEHALSQTASIDELFKTIDDISAEARRVRLDLDKLIKARKDAIRAEIVRAAKSKFDDHIRSLDAILGEPLMPAMYPPIAEAIKGRKTVASIKDAADTALATAKIEANAIQQRILANLQIIRSKPEFSSLFPDIPQLVLKQAEDFAAVASQRINQHQAKAKEKLEREERHKADEAAKAKKDAESEKVKEVPVSFPARTFISLDTICSRLGFDVTGEFLASLGFFSTDLTDLYHESDFFNICHALIRHINKVSSGQFCSKSL